MQGKASASKHNEYTFKTDPTQFILVQFISSWYGSRLMSYKIN
jgi:hypothetical protein